MQLHSTLIANAQDYGFRRHTYRRQAWQSEPRSLRFGSGDEAGNFPATRGAADAKLLLASHNRLLWYHYTTGRVEALHEGKVGLKEERFRCCALLHWQSFAVMRRIAPLTATATCACRHQSCCQASDSDRRC